MNNLPRCGCGGKKTSSLEQLPSGIQFARFAVNRRAACVWEWDLRERNLRFLDELQPDYFGYVAARHGPDLEGDQRHYAATAIRTVYSQALETFIALACALIQAPLCIVGWMQLYRQEDLVEVAGAIARGEECLSMVKGTPLSWKALADACTAHIVLEDKAKEANIRDGYAKLWPQLAADFLEEGFQEEYNSLKHGLRVRPGGFHLRIGREDTPGVAAPPERMVSLGGSEFGASYFRPVRLGPTKRHYRLEQARRNWEPGVLGNRLQLIAISIGNLIGLARILNGVDPTTVRFVWPTPIEAFEMALSPVTGVISATFDRVVDDKEIKELTAEEILSIYPRSPRK